MPPTTYEESGLVFRFSPSWKVLRWDKSPYYKKVSGRGFKGVDFIGIHGKTLYLIEVKNYVPRTSNHLAIIARLETLQPLKKQITSKVDDTLRLLELVAFYLNKKWWIRLAERLHRKGLLPSWANGNYHLWLEGNALAKAGAEQVGIILWLELAPSYTGMPSFNPTAFRKELHQLLVHEFQDYTPTIELCYSAKPSGLPECEVFAKPELNS